MTEIRLSKMRICNFKGIRELDIAFDGRDMNVLGGNGTGKTTIIDSFTWLLFGKDSLGRTDFGIKPTDGEGNIIHQLETEVEAVFDVSGTERAFKKTLSEVWTRKRGAAEAEFTRNENNFYIDGVPKKKGEYTAAINELIDEEVFKIITNPLYFNESVGWKDRRSVLLAICGDVSEEDVIASNAELSPLLNLLSGKTVSDFKDIASSAMKRINQELDMIPVKINEAERAKPSEDVLVVGHERKDSLTKEIEDLRVKKSNIENGIEVQQERQKIELLRRKIEHAAFEVPPIDGTYMSEFTTLEDRHKKLQSAYTDTLIKSKRINDSIEEKQALRQGLSDTWDEVIAVQFTGSACPTCHRELPEDEVEEKRKEFNARKANRLEEIEKQNERIADEIAKLNKELEKAKKDEADIREEMAHIEKAKAEVKDALKAQEEAQKKAIAEIREKAEEEIRASEEMIKRYEESNADMVAEVDSQIAALSAELNEINTAIANNAMLERQDKRIAELREQQKKLAAEYAAAERNLFLAERFIVAKVNMLNERINRKFKYAKFKLFDKQINGGINEVCEVTFNGIPYKDLNNAMRINIGLDVINTLSGYYGITSPIMIDNAESVTDIYHTDAQQIRFYVSHDKKLVFNN